MAMLYLQGGMCGGRRHYSFWICDDYRRSTQAIEMHEFKYNESLWIVPGTFHLLED